MKTPSSIPSAEEQQLNTLEGEFTVNQGNLVSVIWTPESRSNNQLENETQSGAYKLTCFTYFFFIHRYITVNS